MRHVVIVDDALDLGRLLKTALSMIDSTMPVIVVPSAEEALLEATRYPLDLLVTDIMLPGMSGVELIQKIRGHHPDVKIIAITGMSDDTLLKEIRDLGVDALFKKPLSIPDFTETAKRCLQFSTSDSEFDISPMGVMVSKEQEPAQLMSDVLTGLRRRLGAKSVVMLDERARIAAQAGLLPEELQEEGLFSQLQSLASASSGVSSRLGKPLPENVIAYRGEQYHLILSPVLTYTLFTILESAPSNLRLALSFEETLNAQNELTKVLEKMGLAPAHVFGQPQAAESKKPEEQPVFADALDEEIDLEAFKALFETSPIASSASLDADSFWDELSGLEGDVEPENPDVLTYEQARQLGLAPKDEAEN
jgi:DNA-binding response OmpR family regulator